MRNGGSSTHLLNLHLIKVVVSVGIMIIAARVPYTVYPKITKIVLIIALIFLIATLAFGGEVKGASRWLRFGGIGFQPSEFARFALIFHLCAFLAQKKDRLDDFKNTLVPTLIWIGGTTLLVFLQPNFSTGAMILLISFILLYLGGVRLRHLCAITISAIPLIVLYVISAPYRLQRVIGFIHSTTKGIELSYQVKQAIVGFGNGGLFGVGPGNSLQRDFFLPESYGDFVYAIAGEEYGFIGAILILLIFAFIVLRGFRIAKKTQNDFGRLLALGITVAVGLYGLVNAAVTTHLLPTTGLPMPFVSYGGSSLLFTAFAIGVLLNISTYTDIRLREPEEQPPAISEQYSQIGRVYSSENTFSTEGDIR